MKKSTYSNLTDEQLLELMQGDDPLAFETLYNRYWYKLFVSAYRRIQCKEETECAVQSLFESLWKNRGKIHVSSSLENYLFSAIRYIVLRTLYRNSYKRVYAEVYARQQFLNDSSTEERILINDLSKHIDSLIEGLPKKCRNVFQLSRYEMKTHKEIAMLMGISEKTVENHITKALHHIRTNLAHFFFL